MKFNKTKIAREFIIEPSVFSDERGYFSESFNLKKVAFDQVGSPTDARDLAKTCLDIIYNKEKEGLSDRGQICNYSNEGVTSWSDFAKEIMTIGDINCDVIPIKTKDYPTLSKRPQYSVLNKSKIKEDFNLDIPYWKDSLKKCIKKINA